jgi:CubicO group peptidase (beta-lactamase class C family)
LGKTKAIWQDRCRLFLLILKPIMKITASILLLTAITCGCNSFSGNTKVVKTDSLPSYLPPHKKISSKEYEFFKGALTDFFNHRLLRGNGFNGGILVAKNGNIVYEKYVGYADLRKKDPMTATTPLHIASTSKTFTGMAILQLVQQKKLSLNDTITTFFPGLPYPGITVKMLLNHRSGLPNYVYFVPNSGWDKNKMVTNSDVLSLLYTKQPRRTNLPNRRFSYSNTNFVLLAMIVEKITGTPFPVYMKRTFFDPLQMTSTFICTLADSAKATPSFNYDGRLWQHDNLEGTYGDKNVYTTPQDLFKWDQALYTDHIVDKALLDSAFTPYSLERPSIHNYGLGWRLMLMPGGKKIVYHFGRWHGSNAAFARLIDDGGTIIILGNRYDRNIYNSAHDAYKLFGNYDRDGEEDEDNENNGSDTMSAGDNNISIHHL